MLPDLGKYALPVLSAYAVSITLIVAIVLVSWRQAVRTRAALRVVEEGRARKSAASQVPVQEAPADG